ncbi:unnamed protein product, partial [Polarella glacialis]
MATFAARACLLVTLQLALAECLSMEDMLASDDVCANGDESCSLRLLQVDISKVAGATVQAKGRAEDQAAKALAHGSNTTTIDNNTAIEPVLHASVVAGCSAADEALMAKFGSGNADGTFPKILANCGKGAYSFWRGFTDSDMQSCIQEKTGISSTCASCGVLQGRYAYDHCKFQCLFGITAEVAQCTGVTNPTVEQC